MKGMIIMRDPNRIDDICDLLREVWKQYPDWRLGQLIFNLTGKYDYDCFYVEDETLKEALKMNLQKEKENE